MGAIDEMYKKYGATFKVPSPMMLCANGLTLETYYESEYTEGYKPFTAKKQLEVIKFLIINGYIFNYLAPFTQPWVISSRSFSLSVSDDNFTNVLALILIESYEKLSNKQRQEVKEILERWMKQFFVNVAFVEQCII